MKLTSSKCFGKTLKDKTDSEYRRLRDNFDYFIEQPLTLGMFVPCDEEWIILSECTYLYDVYKNLSNDEKRDYKLRCENYQQAKERVLFEGFEIVEKREVYDSINGILIDLDAQTFQIEGSLGVGGGYLIDEIIEDLSTLGITLTKTAIKQIGL